MRLQAFLARAGAAPSRRKAEALIVAGRVAVNGKTATLGSAAETEDTVSLDGYPVRLPAEHAYLALNKPAGYLSTMQDEPGRERRIVRDLMPPLPGLVPVGRLDAQTTGLLLATNDGELAHRVTHPSSLIEKEYELTLKNPVPQRALAALAAGPQLDDGPMFPPKLEPVHRDQRRTTLRLTIHEGRNRIIRRACAAVGLDLASLRRVRIGPVKLGGLPEGEHRNLTPTELAGLR